MKRYLFILMLCICFISFVFPALSESVSGSIAVQEIRIDGSECIAIPKGGSFTCTPQVFPEGAACDFEWVSSDPAVATVKNGIVKGVKTGKCDISCKALDGSDITAVCHIEVWNPVKRITLSDKKIELLVGASEEVKTRRVTYTIAPDDTFWKDVTWQSSDEQVVTVDDNGILHGIAAGKAQVTAFSTQPDSKVKAQIQVIVCQAADRIELEKEKVTLLGKKDITVKATIGPDNVTNKKIVWSSEDETIASVNSKGKIKAIEAGTTTIIARAADGSGIEARLNVRVVQPVLSVSIDGDTYDYGKRVKLTAQITNPDGSTDGLDEVFPSVTISSTLQTDKGKKVPGFIVQESSGLKCNFGFPMCEETMGAGNYKIHVSADIENLSADSSVFHYTADRSWLPPLSDCNIKLTLNLTELNLNEPLIMTAKVTDKDGNPIPGVKVSFAVQTINRGSSRFFGKYKGIWNVTDENGACAVKSTIDEQEAKAIPAGKYIVRVYIVGAVGADEAVFEFTGK